MADQIGEAVVKITADVTPLQQAVNKVEQIVAPLQNKELEGFKIRYDDKVFESFEQYSEAIKQQEQEWEQYAQEQERVTQTTEETTTATRELSDAVAETAQKAEQTTTPLQTLGGNIKNFGKQIQASVLDAKVAIVDSGRIGRTALIGLSAAFVALGKSSIKEYAKYNEEAANTQEKLATSMSKVKASIGQMLTPMVNVVANIADWASKNPQLVNGVLTLVGTLAGSAGLIALVTKLSNAITALKTTAGGIIGIISTVIGLVTMLTMSTSQFDSTLADIEQRRKETEEWNNKVAESYKQMNDTIANSGKSMKDSLYAYQQSLKKILIAHEETVENLNQQIKDANDEYIQSVNERNAAFLVSQAKEEEEHQKKVDELMTQLNFLQRYNNKYNKEKLEAVQFALAKEEELYRKKTQAEKEELDLQNEYDRKKRDERLAEYEKELNEERAFLTKHAEIFRTVRNVMVDDEVEALQRQFRETQSTYTKEVEVARNSYNKMVAEAKKATDNINGYLYAEFNGVMTRVETTYKGKLNQLYSYTKTKSPTGDSFVAYTLNAAGMAQVLRALEGYASGGYTGQGGENEVAGVVHKGEYVLPQEMVDQTTGTPKIGSNITINVNGTFATSDLERRRVAEQIVNALKQTNYARLGV